MSTAAEGAVSMKLIPSSGELFIKEMSQTKLPLPPLEALTSSKEQLFSIGLGISNTNSEKKTGPSLSSHLQFNSKNSLLYPVQNSMGSKAKKRPRSKSGPKNRKKGKIGQSSNTPDDEALDTDIFAFVESLNTNKNLDSDSSTNTIILDDLNNHISNNNANDAESELCVNLAEKRTEPIPGEVLFSDRNFQEGSDKHLPMTATSPYSVSPIFSSIKTENNLQFNYNQEICTNFYNSSKGRVLISQKPSSVSESECLPLIKSSHMEGVPQKTVVRSESTVSSLNKANKNDTEKFLFKKEDNQNMNEKLILDTSNINPVFIPTSNPPSHLESLLTNKYTVSNPFAQSHSIDLSKQKSAKNISGAQVSGLEENSSKTAVSSASSFVPNLRQHDQKLNYQSVYASMGLDEDLCDLDDHKARQKENKCVTKNPHSSVFSNEFNSVQLPVKIKTEEPSPFIPSYTAKNNDLAYDSKNEILSNDLHVSMTFEAEPLVDDDDDDDLPLSELKNQLSAEEIVPKMKEKSEQLSNFIAGNVNDIHPSLFIKKELIEDEIVSESQAVSSQNLFSASVASSNTDVKTSISSAYNDCLAVKIKTEPKDDYPGSESAEKFPVSLNCNPAQVAANNTDLISEVSLRVKHNSSLELTMNKKICQPYNTIENTTSPSFASKPQSENKLNLGNASSLPSVSSFTNQKSTFAGSTSDSSVTVAKPSKTNRASKKRKSCTKNTENVSKKVKKSFSDDFEPHKNLTTEALQGFNLCGGNSDLNSSRCVTDTDTESNSSKKKGKRKKNSMPVRIDENLPITLLIKRQTSDATDENTSNSFLCTNISKSSASESKSSLSAVDKIPLLDCKESGSSDIGDLNMHSKNLVMQQKNKGQNKKKRARKPKGKNQFPASISDEMMQCENKSSNSLNVPIKSDHKIYSKNSELNSTKFENSNSKCADSLKTQPAAEQKGETFVYMTFEEQSPAEDITEDDINSVLSIKKEKDPSPPRENLMKSSDVSLGVIKNIKQEKENFLLPDSQVSKFANIPPPDCNSEQTHSSHVEESLSTISSVASNSNIDDDSNVSALSIFDNSTSDLNLNVQTKKKKRRARSNGWYKKKKSKAKTKTKAQILPSVEIKEPPNYPAMAVNKVPVVIIKNYLPELKKDGVLKMNNTVCLEQQTVELPSKGKKKKRATSGKKKKAAKTKQNKTIPKESGSECQKSDQVLNCPLQSESVQLPEKANFGNDILTDVSVSDQCSKIPVPASQSSPKPDQENPAKEPQVTNNYDAHSNPPSSNTEKSRYTLFPTLDVDEIRQEIAACEVFFQNLGESSDKSKQSSLGYDSRELNVSSNSSEPNILETFNMSANSGKSKSFPHFYIKKEPDDPKNLVYSPRKVSLLSSDKNDKLDNLCDAVQISNENHRGNNKDLSVKQADCNLPLADLSVVKKEKEVSSTVQDKFVIGATTEISDKSVLVNSTIENSSANLADSVSKINTSTPLQSESLKNLVQNPLIVDIDKIALSIKKEVYCDAKSRSSNYGIKDQNDLIQKACSAEPGKLITVSPSLPDVTTATKSVCSLKSRSSDSVQKYNLEGDDEIQILKIGNQSSKDVPIVDLTEENNKKDSAAEIQDDIFECKVKSTKILPMPVNTAKVSRFSCSAAQSSAFLECSTKVSSTRQGNTDGDVTVHSYSIQGNAVQSSSSQINSKIVCGNLYDINNVIKMEKSNVNSSIISTPVNDSSLEEKSYVEENKQANIDNKKKIASLGEELGENRKFRNNEDSLESVTKEEEEFAVKFEVSNSAISKDKYFEEYFKHPFPPSMVLHNTKQRNRNKMYTRINSKVWNLSIEEVETRLKLSENIMHQLEKDTVILEKYPVSVNEVECYHRILGVAPSHKLLSKCFKSPEKKRNPFINNGLNAFSSFPQANLNCIETEKQINQMTCSLDDIIKGITETKMMFSKNNAGNTFSLSEKDCPSTESRDSSDSFISNMSGVQSRELRTPDNVHKVRNEFIHNESSNGRSSALSCKPPTFSESDLTELNVIVQKSLPDKFVSSFNSDENINIFPSPNTLNSLNLPTQEAVNNIVNSSNASSGFVGTYDNAGKYYSEVKSNIVSVDSQSSSSCQSFNAAAVEFKSNDESKLQSEKKQVFDFDVPVTELRKILETVESLPPESLNYDDGFLWKSQATYEYNHTHSVPVLGKNSKCNNSGLDVLPSEIVPSSSYVSQSAPQQTEACGIELSTEASAVPKSTLNAHTNTVKEDSISESEQGCAAKKTVQDDSDSDCVDNEPICHEDYEREKDEDSSHAEEATSEERPIPQYKSKWEKIMERKSLENKKKDIGNEHLLKDCFPVASTRTRNMVSLTSNKSIPKTIEKPSKVTSSDKRQNKDDKMDFQGNHVKNRQNDSNSLKSNLLKQNNKSSKNSKGKEEKNKAKSISEKETNKRESAEKNKSITEKVTKSKTSMTKKNKIDDSSPNLFAPDKPVKVSKGSKQDAIQQSNEDNKSKRFYGNRITNRGTFLTESSSSADQLKKIKIPKKKRFEIPKKNFNVRSEEFHSMVKSPDINIEPAFHSKYKTFNKSLDSRKNSESYRSPLENTSSSPSSSSYFIRTKHARDRRIYYSKFEHQERRQYHKNPFDPRSNQSKNLHDENILCRKPLLNTPGSISPLMNDESSMNRKSSLLNTPSIPFITNDESTLHRKTSQFSILPSLSSHQSNDGSIMGRNNSHLGPLTSTSSHPSNDGNQLCKKIPNLITSPSIPPKLPVESFQPNVNSEMNLLHSILSAINSNKIPTVPEIDDELPFSDSANPSWDKYESNSSSAYNFKESSSRQGMNEPAASINKSHGIIHPLNFFDTLKPSSTHSVSTAPLKNPFDPILDSSGILNSPPFNSSVNSSAHIPSQPNKKAICLVPQHLKTLVGHKTIETHNVRLLMLEWSVDWLVQQQQFHDPPPISNALKKVVSTYDSFEDYYNTYFPLMLLETWHRIYVSWTHLNQANPYSCQITSYSVKSHYVSVDCQTVFNTAAHPKGVFPDEGSILMVKYTTKSNEYTIKILGYVTHVKTRRFNCVTDSKLFSSLRLYKDANPDVLQILSLTFMGAFNSEDIDKRQPIRIHVLCNVKPTLKQNDAMLYINNSPLQRSILNPVADGLLSFTLTPRNSPLEKTNECVRDITKGILTPHPLPLLTVVRAKPESDRLNIIPMLIEKMKCAYKTKVLLCVRTVRALGDIAANICLHQSLKLVIINKRCDTNPQFQKFLLDELATAEMSKCSEDKVNEKHVKNETIAKVKKQVLKECDVVLSLIRNCHDEFIGETFTETECVSQMCCIVDEANLCTEPETLIPILHGISKLILIGDSDYPAKVLSKTASAYDYSQSFFQRAYDLDLITE